MAKKKQDLSALEMWGVTLPEGKEIEFLVKMTSEYAGEVNRLERAVEGMVKHIGALTEGLVLVQNELRAGIKHNKEAFSELGKRVDELQKDVEELRKERGASFPAPPK